MRPAARVVIATVIAGTFACASGGNSGGGSAQTDQTVRVVGGNGTTSTVGIRSTTSASVSRVGYPIDRVWRALPAAYDSLKIPLTTLDAAKHKIGNEGMTARQKLGNVALSRYIDCGQAQIGPSADNYDVYLNILTTVRSLSPTETEISTAVESAARPVTVKGDYARCSSKGQIESRISSIVNARLAAQK